MAAGPPGESGADIAWQAQVQEKQTFPPALGGTNSSKPKLLLFPSHHLPQTTVLRSPPIIGVAKLSRKRKNSNFKGKDMKSL